MSERRPGIGTILTHRGRDPKRHGGAINPPVVRASTFLFDSYDAFINRKGRDRHKHEWVYGRVGTETSVALESLVAELEGAADCFTLPSGVAAIAAALLSALRAGDHLLVADSVYEPTRRFCQQALERLGIEVEFYDPLIGAGIERLCRPNTRAIFLESPGSLTFEVQDLPAIAGVARPRGIVTMIDSTWASPLGLKPLSHGIDIAIHTGTKHFGGHSDVMIGLIACNAETLKAVKGTVQGFGLCAGTEELFLTLRGLRSLEIRLERSTKSAFAIARWLQQRPEVAQVLYPPLPEDPGHALWQRDFTGACGLFGVILAKPYGKHAIAAMVDDYRWFGIGASWGGYESLVVPGFPEQLRTAKPWQAPGPLLRYAIGLEDPADLIADLEAGFARLAKAEGG